MQLSNLRDFNASTLEFVADTQLTGTGSDPRSLATDTSNTAPVSYTGTRNYYIDPSSAGYSITTSAASIEEGETATFTIQPRGIADGTIIDYVVSGITNSDINTTTSSALTGSLTINAANDAHTLTFNTLRDNIVDSDIITVNIYATGTTMPSLAEASITVTNLLPLLSGTTANSGVIGATSMILNGIDSTLDLSQFPFGIITIGVNNYNFTSTPIRNADNTVTFTIRAAATAWSTGASYTIDPEAEAYNVTFSSTNINEGGTITATLNTRGVTDGTNVAFTLSNSTQFYNLPSTLEFTVNNNTATFEFTPLLDGVERTNIPQEVTLTLTPTMQTYNFGINNFSTPDNTGAFFGRSVDTIVARPFGNSVRATSTTIDLQFPRFVASGTTQWRTIIPATGTLRFGNGENTAEIAYTSWDRRFSDTPDTAGVQGQLRFQLATPVGYTVMAMLYGGNARGTLNFGTGSSAVNYDGNIKQATAIELDTLPGMGVTVPYGIAAVSTGNMATTNSASEGFNKVDIIFPEGAYGRESGFRNIPQQGTIRFQNQDDSTFTDLTYDSWDTTHVYSTRPFPTRASRL